MAGGSEVQKKAWLPKLASGEAIGTLAIAEGPGKADVRKLRTTYRGGALSGEKLPVPDGDVADVAIVAAQGERGVVLAIADLSASGVQREAVETIDPSRSHARIGFENTPAEALGSSGDGERLLRRVQDRAAVLFAFEQVGGAQRSLEMARDYALQRYAFGRPIGSFQAIKHKLADVYVATELARSNAYYGAWALARDARGAAACRCHGPDIGQRGLLSGGEGEHPGARRHGLHLGVRLPPLLPPRQAAVPRAGQHEASGRTGSSPSSRRPTRRAERLFAKRGRPWISTTLPKRPRSARACEPSSTRTPSSASRAPAWSIAPATTIRSSARKPRTGRPRRPTPAMPGSPGRRTGAGAAARPSNR